MTAVLLAGEGLTALIYLFLALSLPLSAWSSFPPILRRLHFVTVIIAALAIAWGASRRRPWSAKAAVVLAAVVGVPNLAIIAQGVDALRRASGPTATLSIALVFLAGMGQLAALLVALTGLRVTEAAA